MVDSYVEYQRLYQDEAIILRDGTLRSSLCAIFNSAPKLNDIVINSRDLMKHTRREQAYSKAVFEQWVDEDALQCEALTEILLAAHAAKRKIKRLEANDLPPRFFAQTPANLATFGLVLDELEELTLYFGLFWYFHAPAVGYGGDIIALQTFDHGGIARFMTLCQRIHKLGLHKLGTRTTPWEMTSLQTFVGSITFSNLTDLRFHDFTSTQNEFEAVLSRHKITLRTVSLDELGLSEGRWDAFFTAISGKLPNIKRGADRTSFTLCGTFANLDIGDDDTNDVETINYVVRADDYWIFSQMPDDTFTKRMQDYIRIGGTLPTMLEGRITQTVEE